MPKYLVHCVFPDMLMSEESLQHAADMGVLLGTIDEYRDVVRDAASSSHVDFADNALIVCKEFEAEDRDATLVAVDAEVQIMLKKAGTPGGRYHVLEVQEIEHE